MSGGRSQADDVKIGAAADADDVGMAINAGLFEDVPCSLQGVGISFATFTSSLHDGASGYKAWHMLEVIAYL